MRFSSSLSTSRGHLWKAMLVVCLCATACAAKSDAPDTNGDDDSGGAGGQAGGNMPPGGEGGSVDNEGGAAGEAAGGAGGEANAEGGAGGVEMPMAGSGGMAGAGGGPVTSGGNQGTATCTTNAACDDFESYAPGPFKAQNGWTVAIEGGAGMVVDETRARSGKRSIKISVAAGGEGDGKQAFIGSSNRTVLNTGKSAYARMMVYLDAVPSGQGLHWAFMRANGFHTQDGKSAILAHSIGGQPSRLRNLMLWKTSEALQDCFNDSNTQIPAKRWTCVEWHLDPESQTMEVWFDGQKQTGNSWTTKPAGGRCAADQTGGKWVIPKISVMYFGWIHYHSINGATMWLDDIALDTKRIGCPQ